MNYTCHNKKRSHSQSLAVGLAVAVFALLISGCKKFLDVPPKDNVPQSTLFRDEQGFKEALLGVYLGMDRHARGGANLGLYTNDLSMGMMSTLAYHYDNANVGNAGSNGAFYNNVVYYIYLDGEVRKEIDGIWSGLYNNIADLNNILQEIDGKKDVFTRDNYNRVKGEAIALRALFHFDLARMFGKSPVAGMQTNAIPYITRFGVTSTRFIPLQSALDSCIKDLTIAKDLLAAADTSAILKSDDDLFSAYTQNHINYWAVQGLLARVYLYRGDNENADKYARAVIGSNKFPLITSNVAAKANIVRDRTFAQEHLFSVYSTNIKKYNADLFDKTAGVPLRFSPAGRKALYTTGSGNSSDYRYTSWFDNSQLSLTDTIPSKFFQDNNLPYELQNNMPVIRVSEMYYIAAECANKKNDIVSGASLLNKVRQARGLNALNGAGITSTDSLSTEIMREYQKEFIQEGQTWFYYKRLNKDLKQVISTPALIPADVYVFPIPDKEKEYNY